MSLSTTISEKAGLIWAIADKLTGAFKPHQYGEVILPLTVIRRFDSALEPSKKQVLETYARFKDSPFLDGMLKKASGHVFYNTSPFTFSSLLNAPADLAANFQAYCNGFSENARQILDRFKPFWPHVTVMNDKGILYQTLKEFTGKKADLHPDSVSNLEMGYIFEELIRRFSEAHNEDAGQHYTPREVIELMVNLLMSADNEAMDGSVVTRTIYDPACGTGGMLSVAESHIHRLNANSKLILSGQELNDETFAICKADMLIKGNDAEYIKPGNTLSNDQFPDNKFDYILSNPPFGREWKNEKDAVLKEAAKADSRFHGLPAISDSQMLFLQTVIDKLNANGKAAVIQNGSPLFTGDAGSGPSEIRKYILENDLLEAIIALPNDIFYNTGIATYIWVFNKNKPDNRKGKVQLINANNLFEKRRKSLGKKRNDIPQSAIDEICQLYGEFEESKISKIFKVSDFGYTKITVERPYPPEHTYWQEVEALKKDGKKLPKKLQSKADPDLRDTENVPLNEDIRAYFEREVLPYSPDAWIDHDKSVVGYEIPFNRYFYEYTPPQSVEKLEGEIKDLEANLTRQVSELFGDK